jgi:hypothetical protein
MTDERTLWILSVKYSDMIDGEPMNLFAGFDYQTMYRKAVALVLFNGSMTAAELHKHVSLDGLRKIKPDTDINCDEDGTLTFKTEYGDEYYLHAETKEVPELLDVGKDLVALL